MTRFFYSGSIEAVGPSTDRSARVVIEGIPPDTDLKTRFRRAPILMWSHNHDVPAIGRARELSVDESGKLTALVEFSLTPDGEIDLYGKVERGFQPVVEAFIDGDGVLNHLSLVNRPTLEEREDAVRALIEEHYASRELRCDDRLSCCTACEQLASGGYRIPAVLGKAGVVAYAQPGGGVRREFRPPEEVFSDRSLASLKGAPVTLGHRGGMVDTRSWREQSIGHVGDDVRRDGDTIVGTIVVADADAIKLIDSFSGPVGISPGYDVQLDPTPGEWNGEKYDAVQRNITINHVSVVDSARQGSEVRLRLDSDDPPPQPPRQVDPPAQLRTDSKETPTMSKQHFPNNADPIVARNRKVLRARGMQGKAEAAREAEREAHRLDDGLEDWERKPTSVHGIGGGMSGEATPAQQRQQELDRKHRQDAAERAEAYRRERAKTRLDEDLPEGAQRLDTSRPINQPRQRWQEPANGRFGMSKDSAQLFEMNQRLARIERNTSGSGGTGGEAA